MVSPTRRWTSERLLASNVAMPLIACTLDGKRLLQETLMRRYDALCRHYGMRASRCNPGQSHENSSIESRHDSLKTALDQALRLRGSGAFDGRAVYEAFVEQIVQRLNARAATRLDVERPLLKPLPARRTASTRSCPRG